MSWEATVRVWAPVAAACFAALAAAAAWRNAYLAGRAQRRDLEARRAYVVAHDVNAEPGSPEGGAALSFRLKNLGQRQAFEVGGHALVLLRALATAPEQLAPFSLANELPPGIDILSCPEGPEGQCLKEPAFLVIVISYVDHVLDQAFTSWYAFTLDLVASRPDLSQAPLKASECSLEDGMRVLQYLNRGFPGLLQNNAYHEQVKIVRSARDRTNQTDRNRAL